MGKLERDGRVIVAEGGSCPSLERLGNGDLLVAYRDDTHSKTCVSMTRSTDCGRTWRKEHTFAYGASAQRTDEQFYGHHGMAQLADGTILLPYNVYGTTYSGVYNRTVCVRRSVDQGHTWSEPIVVVPGPGPASGWSSAISYGKIRTLHDGTVILPIIGRHESDRFGRHGYLTSHDGGETWDSYVTAACDRYSGDEADFLQLPSGRILCVNRDPSNTHGHGVGPLFCNWSDDNGATWSSHEMVGWSDPRYGHSPALFLTRTGTVICGYRHVAEMDHLHIGSVAFCYVKEDGLDWSGETHIWGGPMYLSFLMQFHAMGQGYPSFAYADDERILVVHHNQPPPAVGERDIEGVFYVEQDEEAAWRGDVA